MKQTRNFAGFWSSLFAKAQVTYLTFILLTLQTFTKLKTTFGHTLKGVQNVASVSCFFCDAL
jgi:hypothetical protein